ncbi:helix-turn-helix domain-containing protein [Microbacterium sp. ZW T5_56]|uniref:helix-turn-helix domain-containing protein n=1 Tax=Microbacterium sp. ZW T5_56 TaxID=3378081 RepID=UPI003853466C
MTTVDESFGASVAKARTLRGMSQKELSSALAQLGMKVDAPAVSRIEKGQRSLRLTEATTVATALGVDLTDLLQEPGTIQERVYAAYDQIGMRTTELAQAASKFAQSIFRLSNLIEGAPEQLNLLKDGDAGAPATGREVPAWYSRLLRSRYWDLKRERVSQDRFAIYSADDDIDGVRAAILAAIEPSLVTVQEHMALEDQGVVPRSLLDAVWVENVLGGGDGSPQNPDQ